MKFISLLIVTLGLTIASHAMAEPLTFRGLGSSSTSADVKRVFPQVKNDNLCRDGEKSSRSADGETKCEQLRLTNYVLDNIEFNVSFIFNMDGTLRHVSIIKLYGVYTADKVPVSAGTLRSTFRSLADLLSSKYGPAVDDAPGYDLKFSPVDQKLQWQPGRGEKWQSGGDRISLSTSGIESRTEPGMYNGTIHIFYTFAKRDQLDRI